MSLAPLVRGSAAMVLAVTVVLGTAGCISLPHLVPDGTDIGALVPSGIDTGALAPETSGSAPDASAAPGVPGEDGADGHVSAAVLAELEEFRAAQNLPEDLSEMLVASTPAQKEFIAQERSQFEEWGWEWTADDEDLALYLAVDACQVAILNGHVVDDALMTSHMAESPLIDGLITPGATPAERHDEERFYAGVMSYGTTYLCASDGQAWMAAYLSVYAS